MTGDKVPIVDAVDRPPYDDEQLISRAVVSTALQVGEDDLRLDREDIHDIGPWRTKRVAHYAALAIGKEQGFSTFESLRFIWNVKRAAGDLRVIDAVRGSQDE